MLMQIFHKWRGTAEVLKSARANTPAGLVWERKELPDAGAGQYAYETYGTPLYDFALGNGATFIRRPLLETQPAMWAHYAQPIISNPPYNAFQGQFATQPLMDPNTAQSLGVTAEGAIPPGPYNAVLPQPMVLAP